MANVVAYAKSWSKIPEGLEALSSPGVVCFSFAEALAISFFHIWLACHAHNSWRKKPLHWISCVALSAVNRQHPAKTSLRISSACRHIDAPVGDKRLTPKKPEWFGSESVRSSLTCSFAQLGWRGQDRSSVPKQFRKHRLHWACRPNTRSMLASIVALDAIECCHEVFP